MPKTTTNDRYGASLSGNHIRAKTSLMQQRKSDAGFGMKQNYFKNMNYAAKTINKKSYDPSNLQSPRLL